VKETVQWVAWKGQEKTEKTRAPYDFKTTLFEIRTPFKNGATVKRGGKCLMLPGGRRNCRSFAFVEQAETRARRKVKGRVRACGEEQEPIKHLVGEKSNQCLSQMGDKREIPEIHNQKPMTNSGRRIAFDRGQ